MGCSTRLLEGDGHILTWWRFRLDSRRVQLALVRHVGDGVEAVNEAGGSLRLSRILIISLHRRGFYRTPLLHGTSAFDGTAAASTTWFRRAALALARGLPVRLGPTVPVLAPHCCGYIDFFNDERPHKAVRTPSTIARRLLEMTATAKTTMPKGCQFDHRLSFRRLPLGAFGKQDQDYDHDVFNSAGYTLARPHFGLENGVHLSELGGSFSYDIDIRPFG